jgi:non-ribosomal peptide synthase protein (TIGR01720 family)
MPFAYGARINEALLTALARSLANWTGGSRFRLELEGHGRELPFGGVDLSRTVGWFTTIYPVLLDVDPKLDDRNALRSIGRLLRRVPDQGISYALASKLHEASPPIELIFNYLGQFDQTVDGSTLFKFAAESAGAWHAPRAHRTHAIEVVVRVADGQLEIRWIYSPTLHDRSTILKISGLFVSELRGLAQRASATVERLSAMVADAVDRYPLTPMQRLFYTMSTTGYEAWRFAIEGEVDAARLHRAWEMLLDRHTILRTAFMIDGAHEPLQFVLRSAKMPILVEIDLQGMDGQSQEQHIHRLAHLELERGFDLSEAPLMRVALVRLADQRYEMMWSTHHLYIDGWSWPILIEDLSECYNALCDEREPLLPPACPYGRYVRWLDDEAPDGDSFWRQEMAGFVSPSPIDLEELPVLEASNDPGEVVLTLASDASDKLIALARGQQTTASVVVQGAWALLLSHIGATEDVVFGAAYSGRPAEISGVDRMVGPCVNNIPVRVCVDTIESVADYVARLQQRQHELNHHQFSPLVRIQELAGVPFRLRLFESLIVFQNYVVSERSGRMGSRASLRLIDGPDATNYPLTLVVVPGPQMQLKLLYQPVRLTRRRAEGLLSDLAGVLTAMGATPEMSVGSVLAQLPEQTRGRAAKIVAQRRERRTMAAAAPSTALEQTIATMWAELFQVDRIGLDENFFDLGGHSLLLLEAHRRLRAQTRATLPVVALFQYPTVRSLSRFLGGEATESNARDVLTRAAKQKEALARMTRPRLGRQ